LTGYVVSVKHVGPPHFTSFRNPDDFKTEVELFVQPSKQLITLTFDSCRGVDDVPELPEEPPDKPAGQPPPRPEQVERPVVEEPVWPPPKDQQNF
jgi:hypothetical protein